MKSHFSHGSHVAGIAAGKHGIAPEANIVAILAMSEKSWTCQNAAERERFGLKGTNQCYSTVMQSSDIAKAYQYIISNVKNGKLTIDALNMSYSSAGKEFSSSGVCDSNAYAKRVKPYFDQINELGILPISTAGNTSTYDRANPPSCISNVYAVSALADDPKPQLAVYSNVSKIVDIAAPGTNIYSSIYPSG